MTTQILLTIHTIALFRTIPLEIYGIIGIIYSLCYLLASLATAGLDSALGSMLTFLDSQHNVRRMMKEQLLYTAIIINIGCIIIYYIYAPFIQNHKGLSIILVGIILAESMKKMFKSYCAVLGNFKASALIDMSLVVSYSSIVWGLYFLQYTLTFYTLFIPLFISTCISSAYFFYFLYKQYKELPLLSSSPILKYTPCPRLYGFLTHSTHYIFSGNVLVPLTASTLGLSYAALLKLLSNCIHTIITIIEKMFGITSTVLFAHTHNKQYVVTLIMRYILPLAIISLSGGIYGMYLFLSHKQSLDLFSLACAFVLIHAIHIFALTYERLLLDRHKGITLISITLLTSVLSFCIWYITSGVYTSVLFYCALSKALYLIGLIIYSYFAWHIVPVCLF